MKIFLVIGSVLIFVSLACSSYKSAGSPTSANGIATINQAEPQPANSIKQEKTPCTLKLAGAPEVKGLRLGMTPDEVLALFPGSRDDADVRAMLARPPSQFGMSELVIRPAKFESREQFAENNQISFTLLDGRVSSFSMGHNGPEFSHVDKFVAKFAEGTGLPPPDQWEPYVGMDNSLKVLKCAEFEVRVFAGGPGGSLNYVLVKDLLADEKLKDRRKKAREKASPSPGQ